MGEDVRKEDDAQVDLRLFERAGRHAVPARRTQDRVEEEEDERRQHAEERELERHEFPEDLLARGAVPFPELDREERRVPRADEHAERAEQHHDRERERDARHRVLAAPMPDVHAVDDRVERVQRHRDERGPRKTHKETPKGRLRKVLQSFLCPHRARR